MSDIVIKVENLSKCYRLGELHKRTNSFRERVSQAFIRIAQSAKRKAQNLTPSAHDAMPHACPASPVTLADGAVVGLEDRTGASCAMASSTDDAIWALLNVSFEVKRGEIVGIIGSNGAGKSTLLKILSRITKPTKGKAWINGRVGSLLEVGTGFHAELTGRENIFLNGAIIGMSKAEIKHNFDEIVDFAEIEKFIDTPVKRYSSGMYVRLAFAVAAHFEPEILLVDEVLAVGDLQFQNKCLGKMGDVSKEGRSIVFVSHNLGAISRLCPRSILLNNGSTITDDDTEKVIENYIQSSVVVNGSWERSSALVQTKSVSLLLVNIVDKNGRKLGLVSYSEGFLAEITYKTFIKDRDFVIALRITDAAGIDIFTTWDTDRINQRHTNPGETYKTYCSIPGYFLRPGIYTATVLCHLISGGKVRTIETANLTLEISEVGYQINRGRLGIITPLFEWHTEKDDNPAHLYKCSSFKI